MDMGRPVFSVYVSDDAIELRGDRAPYAGEGRLVCSQHSYSSLYRFATNLAKDRHLPLWDYTVGLR